jgi:flagellar hook-associated protein 3 FlgL
MRTTSISTMSLMNTPRTGVARMQSDLVRLNKEVITGRMADVGLNLGGATGRTVTLRIDKDYLATLATSNAAVTTRLDQTQDALSQLATAADDFRNKLISSGTTSSGTVIRQAAQAALSTFVAQANASDGRDYLLGGINSSVPPIANFDAGASAAVDAAFLAKFGVTQDDPAVASISATAISDFIDNEFAALFADPAWGADWSSASDQPIASRISPTETIDSSVSANQPAMRKLAMVYTMVAALGIDKLNDQARQAVVNKAIGAIGNAGTDLTTLQADLGTRQTRVKEATERLTVQQTIIDQRISAIEGVDPADAKVRIDMLSTQIEMSYSLTYKLLQISILNYA